MAGYDTASPIQNVYASAHSEFGANPNFWLRYFSPSPYASVVNSDPGSECTGAWNSGGPRIGPIMAPVQSRLSGSYAEGQADAQTFCAALWSTYASVGPLLLPNNGMLFCWLDQEYSTSLSVSYWNGWANYVGYYQFGNNGEPLYPCLYCDPNSPYPNCSTIGSTSVTFACTSVWSSEPEPCTRSITNPPSWKAYSCSGWTPTQVWQYGEQGACGYSASVDLDVGAPGFNTANYCFYLTAP